MDRMYEGWSNIFESRELSVSWAVQVNEELGHRTQWLPLDGCTKALKDATFSNKFS